MHIISKSQNQRVVNRRGFILRSVGAARFGILGVNRLYVFVKSFTNRDDATVAVDNQTSPIEYEFIVAADLIDVDERHSVLACMI